MSMSRPVIFLAFANEQDNRVRYLRNLRREAKALRGTLDTPESPWDVVERSNATLTDIVDVFQDPRYRDRIAVFHFGGHANGYQLLLESEEGTAGAHAGGLAAFLAQQHGLQLVFLNGCSTRQRVDGLRNAGVPAVVATSRAIDDRVAVDFAGRFYKGLAAGQPIRRTFDEAVAESKAARGDDPDALHDGRALKWLGETGERVETGWPWVLYPEGKDAEGTQWKLQDALDDPLFGLPPIPPGDLPADPFRYLKHYTRRDAEIFFGRGREIRKLYELVTGVQGDPIVLLHGQTGVGKSSLLEAGLTPRLESHYEVRTVRRSDVPGLLAALRKALDAESGTLREAWVAREAELDRPLVVILDQVEQVFTQPEPAQAEELAEFLDALQELFGESKRRTRGKLILGFRKEWLAEVQKWLRKYDLPATDIFLEHLGYEGIVEAVEGLTRSRRLRDRYHIQVEPGLAGRTAVELLADPDSPIAPTLQILLSKMWDEVQDEDDRAFTTDLYAGLKKKGIALGDFLDQQLGELETWREEVVTSGLALDVLAYHTAPQSTAEARSIDEIEANYGHRWDVVASLLQRCKDLYLLVGPAEGRARQAGVSRLGHDTLAPLVRARFDESDLPGQRARRILEGRAPEWAGGKAGTPLDEADLQNVEAGQDGMRARTGAEERLVVASQGARDKQARNRLILRWAAIAAVAIIVLVAAAAGWQWQTAEARRREAERHLHIAAAQKLLLEVSSQ